MVTFFLPFKGNHTRYLLMLKGIDAPIEQSFDLYQWNYKEYD